MDKEQQTGKRSESMRVRLDVPMMRRFEAQAADRGMAPSTLAAFVLAEYVCNQERTLMVTRYIDGEGNVVQTKPAG